MTWDTFFYLPEDTPVKPRYLYRDVPGIVKVWGTIKLLSAGKLPLCCWQSC